MRYLNRQRRKIKSISKNPGVRYQGNINNCGGITRFPRTILDMNTNQTGRKTSKYVNKQDLIYLRSSISFEKDYESPLPDHERQETINPLNDKKSVDLINMYRIFHEFER